MIVPIYKAYKMSSYYEVTFAVQDGSMRFNPTFVTARQVFTLSCSWRSDKELDTTDWRLHARYLSSQGTYHLKCKRSRSLPSRKIFTRTSLCFRVLTQSYN